MIHERKTWPMFFEPVLNGTKRFEIRSEDRSELFNPGDVLLLREYDATKGEYTGRELTADVTFVMRRWSEFGLKDGYCIMSISNITNHPQK